ncbi:Rrf2 family transcriptional regulator, partial [bacterium]|nr:Rrf2 family transcriptional regulator [bacterium]MBU3955988.1 Rrf2 family transcriptional regulator [bacterium]
MKLSTKIRYGLRAMLDIAKHDAKGLVLLKDVAERQNISGSYLANIFASLVAAQLLNSKRGSRGGFNLARGASRIKLSEITEALEGNISLVECIADPGKCVKTKTCAARVV